MFYNVPEADCQFLLGARSGIVSLPAGSAGDTLRQAGAAQAEASQAVRDLVQRVEQTIEEHHRQAQGSLQETAERLGRLESALASAAETHPALEKLGKDWTDRFDRMEESFPTPKKLQQAMDKLGKESGIRFDRLEESLASVEKIRQAVENLQSARAADTSPATLAQISQRLDSAVARQSETLDTLREAQTRAAAEQQRWERSEEQAKETLDRLRGVESAQQDSLHALQAFRDTVSAVPARQEAIAERLQNGLEEALRATQEALGSRLAEELKAHGGEQTKHLDNLNESAVRNHGRLLQALKKTEQDQEAAFATLRPQLESLTSGVGDIQKTVVALSSALGEVRAATERNPGNFEALGKQVRDVHQFTHDALDAARQRAEGLWSQVETVGRSIGQLALIVKGMQDEVERANGSLAAARTENRSLLLAFHEQKSAGQEEQRRRQAEQARELNNKGVALFHRGSVEASIEAFIRAVELKPDYSEAYNNLGLAYSKRGQSEEAVRYFQKALEIDPQLGEVYNNLGFLFHASAKYERAIEMFTRSLQTGADQSIAYTNIGNTFYKMKQHEKAIAAWKKALDIDPLNESARRGLALFQQDPAPVPAGRA
jgi:Tfp pilus assembly protein PilF/archaellum component FlaC